MLYGEMGPTKRPKLPKLHEKKGTKHIVKEVDKVLGGMSEECSSMAEVQQLLHI